MGWIFPFIAITAICITLIVWRICAAVEDWKDGRKKALYALLEKEREKLQREYEEKEKVLLEANEEELRIFERERDTVKKEYEKAQRARELFEKKTRELQEESNAIIKRYNEAYQTVRRDVLRELSSPMRLDPVREEQFVNEFFTDKGGRAVSEKMDFSKVNVSCKIYSHKSGKTYETSLSSCSCDDCKYNQEPNYICKHMLAFAIRLNAFKIDPSTKSEQQVLCMEREKRAIRRMLNAKKEVKKLEDRIELLEKEKKNYDKWKEEVTVSFPWIAETLVWIEKKYDDLLLDALPTNAHKSEEIVKKVKKEKKELIKRIAELETQIAIFGYFSLDRFRGMPLEEFMAIVDNFNKEEIRAKTPEGIPSGESK